MIHGFHSDRIPMPTSPLFEEIREPIRDMLLQLDALEQQQPLPYGWAYVRSSVSDRRNNGDYEFYIVSTPTYLGPRA